MHQSQTVTISQAYAAIIGHDLSQNIYHVMIYKNTKLDRIADVNVFA
jgi:hypothetical protein